MVAYNRLTIENQQACIDKAKTKKDGVYTFRGIAYRVHDNRITHFACNGEVVIPFSNFNTLVGTYHGYITDGIKLLKGICDARG